MVEPTDRGGRLSASASPAAAATLETDLLREALSRIYGLDPGRYSPTAFQAWTAELTRASGTGSVYTLIERLVQDREFGVRAIEVLRESDMRLFEDAPYWRMLRERVLPWLRTTPYLSVWVPECGGGGAVYSWAILLEEAGLTARTRIYATDADTENLGRAARASLSARALLEAQSAYAACGGTRGLSDYFQTESAPSALKHHLRMQVMWLQFDPAQGESFNEFHFIDGRFLSAASPRHAFKLMVASMPVSGLLALNPQHAPELMRHNANYKEWEHGLYQRIA